MAVPGHTFEIVHPAKSDNEFCLYIIRLWESPDKYNSNDLQSIEMVVEDCKGQRIHVSVPKGLLKRWRVHLHKFKCYKIKNLMVVDPKMKPKLRTIPCIWTVPKLNDENVVLTNDTLGRIAPYLEKPQEQPLVVVLQYFKVFRWNGKTSVQSNFELSKAHINAEFKEVVEFRNRLANNGPTFFGRISQIQSEGACAGAEELINGRATMHTI
ncbi:hypothetical protein PIB30_071318 [Stylosanthes scabra]|uniref:Uncharacterized protein n=1 Tax=Stylosanthes scabra TaxID=79078 RepID=A0ABU6YLA8_9FABA|nr:hypothetical protein [Stylosanthes scabra]